MLTVERLREVLAYNQETGVLTWRIRSGQRVRIGDVAGFLGASGYRVVRIDRKNYRAHRLIWLWMTGSWPISEIDHISGNKDDNRWRNLRDVSKSVNQQNRRGPQANNSTGFLGVSRYRRGFRACIRTNNVLVWLGDFSTAELAYAAFLGAKRTRHAGNTL